MTRDEQFLGFTGGLLSSQATLQRPREIRYIDGRSWAITWMEIGAARFWPWVVEQACEEFNCDPADVDCVDGMDDPEGYEGLDAGHDKITVRGKVVGYTV